MSDVIKDVAEAVSPEELATTTNPIDPDLYQLDGETQAEYNERVPVAVQPVAPAPTESYLGQPL